MVFHFVWVGKTRNEAMRALLQDYLVRLKRFVRCEIAEVKEYAEEGSLTEGKRILAALRPGATLILLDVEGRAWTSYELAGQIENWQNGSFKELTFIVGGASGVSQEVKKAIHCHWSLSRLTLTHEMARVLLVEQLYRAFTILHGLPYQK